jgi:hypothetical protein
LFGGGLLRRILGVRGGNYGIVWSGWVVGYDGKGIWAKFGILNKLIYLSI